MVECMKLRPCLVHGQRALFHRMAELSDGERSMVKAYVELENGCMAVTRPESVRFLDTLEVFETYDWPKEDNHGNV